MKNIQVVECVKCQGVYNPVGMCISGCDYYLGRDLNSNQIQCGIEDNKSRKERYEEQYKRFYGNKTIEFGDKKNE
jgi:hypothetical protein